MRVPNLRLSPTVLGVALYAAIRPDAFAQGSELASATLPAVTVTETQTSDALPATAPGGKTARGARLGFLGNRSILDTPFNITAYTAELARDQGARTLADVLMNDPSVQFTSNSGHLVENFTIRGQAVAAGDIALNGTYGLLPTQHVPIEFVERVELLKGPNALVGGLSPSGGVGGMINLVPKRAASTPLTEITTSYSSPGYGQVHADLGRRFGQEQRLGLRVNAVKGTGETGVQDQKKGREFLSLGLDYQLDRGAVTVDAYHSTESISNGSPGMYQMTMLGKIVAPPASDSNMFRGTHSSEQASGAVVRGEYRLQPSLTAYASLGASNSSTQGLIFGTRVILKNTAGDATGYIYDITNVVHARTAEAGLKGDFHTGAIAHQVNLSASVMTYDYWLANTALTGYAQNIYNPVTPTFPAAPSNVPKTREDVMSGLAVADTMHLLDDRVIATIGGRLQKVEQKLSAYSESAFSPAAAIVVKPWGPDTSLYANYVEGLSPGTTVGVGYANTGESFAPFKTRQAEVGVKLDRAGFSHTFSLFRMEQPSVVTTATNAQSMDGKQRNEGFEWNFSGQLLPSLTLLGGYARSDARYLRNATATVTGKNVIGVPDQALTVGGEWRTPVAGLSVNGRVTHTGKQWLDTANTLQLPSWNRVDLGASYRTVISGKPVTLRAYVENVANRNYWAGVFSTGFATLSSPRTARLSATVAF